MLGYELPQATEGLAGGAEYVAEGPGDRVSGQRKGRRAAEAELLGALLCLVLGYRRKRSSPTRRVTLCWSRCSISGRTYLRLASSRSLPSATVILPCSLA